MIGIANICLTLTLIGAWVKIRQLHKELTKYKERARLQMQADLLYIKTQQYLKKLDGELNENVARQ